MVFVEEKDELRHCILYLVEEHGGDYLLLGHLGRSEGERRIPGSWPVGWARFPVWILHSARILAPYPLAKDFRSRAR